MTAFPARGASPPPPAPGALTAQRLLVSFLLAAVLFEGWTSLDLSRRVARLEERTAALTEPGSRSARDADPERSRAPGPGPEDREPTEENPGEPPRQARAGGQDEGGPGRVGREGRPPHPDLDGEQDRVLEALTTYVGVAGFDDETAAALRTEIENIFANKRQAIEQARGGSGDPLATRAQMEQQRAASDAVFRRLLGDEEALIFEEEVLGVRPRPPRDRPGGEPPGP